jgi:hypothetical protein
MDYDRDKVDEMVLALLALGTIGKLLTVCTPEGTFAHRFRPTYAGANMGHPYGVVEPVSGLRGRPAGTRPIGAGIGHKSVLEWYKRSRCATEPPRDDQGSCAGFSPYLSRTAGSVSSRVPVDRVHACRCSPPRRPEDRRCVERGGRDKAGERYGPASRLPKI